VSLYQWSLVGLLMCKMYGSAGFDPETSSIAKDLTNTPLANYLLFIPCYGGGEYYI
jgi:hypothetical protein